MTDAVRDQIIQNNREISRLLSENEQLLREDGCDLHTRSATIDPKDKRLIIPANLIRSSSDRIQAYHLNTIIPNDRDLRNNISYYLQLADFYQYILTRFNVWGPLYTVLMKQAFVNIVSIIETLIVHAASNINAYCKASCTNQYCNCRNYIKTRDTEKMKIALDSMWSKGWLHISVSDKDALKDLYDLRNKIHIYLTDCNEFSAQVFSADKYNEAFQRLNSLMPELINNICPYYTSCRGFLQ